ncbi:MAG: EamA family transporter, partial [Clostridia bacterium]|nr:EamA family transporter [Clostridia bacterium]
SNNSSKYKAFIAWLTLGILWGATFVATNIGVQNLPSLLMGGIRFLIAGLTAFIITGVIKGQYAMGRKQIINSIVMGILMFGLGNGLINVAQNYVSASITSIILATPPLIVSAVDSYLPNGTRLHFKGWIGLLVCFFAIIWMWMPQTGGGENGWSSLLLLVASSVFWAMGILYGRHNERIPYIWADVGVQCTAAGIFQLVIGTSFGMWADWHNNLPGWLAVLFLALIGTIVGNYCLVYIIDRMPPTKVTTYAYVNTVSAIFLGWLCLDEEITVRMMITAIVIILGVILSQSAKVKSVAKGTC